MNREDAKKLYTTVLKDGSFDERANFLEKLDDWELGLSGQIAKTLSRELDGKFLFGVEIGIMIALDLVYGFRKELNES